MSGNGTVFKHGANVYGQAIDAGGVLGTHSEFDDDQEAKDISDDPEPPPLA